MLVVGVVRHFPAGLVASLLLASSAPSWAQSEGPQPDDRANRPLRVGVAGSAPFVIEGEEPGGISVEVWKEVALNAKLPGYQIIAVPSVKYLLKGVENGSYDVGIGPISITSTRTRTLDFTQPYYDTTMGILAPITEQSAWERIRPFLSRAFFFGLGFLLLVLLSVGLLVWLAERGQNPDQFPRGLAGIGEGMWFALVTMTTVGYGDRVPVSRMGRVVSGVWMLIAMITASSLTAGIATALTLSQLNTAEITSMDSLRERRVAVIKGTTGAEVAGRYTRRLVPVDTRDSAVMQVLTDRADAMVFDLPQLQYYLAQNPALQLDVIDSGLARQRYGFAVRSGDPDLVRTLNIHLLLAVESGRVFQITNRWFASGEGGGGGG